MKIFIKLLFVISFSYASVVSINDIESIALNFINQKNPSNMQYEVDKITKVDNLYFIDYKLCHYAKLLMKTTLKMFKMRLDNISKFTSDPLD